MDTRTRKQIAQVLRDRQTAVANRKDVYDNQLGCYNCGDCGHVYRDLNFLANALADVLYNSKAGKRRFIKRAGFDAR